MIVSDSLQADIENELIASILINPNDFTALITDNGLTVDHFYYSVNKAIFTAISELISDSKQIDPITIKHQLNIDNYTQIEAELYNIESMLFSLINRTHVYSHAATYANFLKTYKEARANV